MFAATLSRASRIPRIAALGLLAGVMGSLLMPAGAFAHAGGAETSQVIIGTFAAVLLTVGMLVSVVLYRQDRFPAMAGLARFSARVSGLPSWAALPLAVFGGALIVAVFGMYWDISIHIDNGRDEGPFANPAHYLIFLGLFGVMFGGLLGMTMAKQRPSASAVDLPFGIHSPLGALLIVVCASFSLVAFPLDDVWHRLFGQDVTLWGPTHLILFGGASLATLGGWMLHIEAKRSSEADAEPVDREKRKMRKLETVGLAGAVLIGLSTFQGEFDFGVPQYRLDFQPILVMLAGSVALVAARLQIGRGGALATVLFFLAVRGALALIVGVGFDHVTPMFPLYIAEAIAVEAVALALPRARAITFGAVAGLAVGTFGLAGEWAWSQVAWATPWTTALLPGALIAALIAAVAGGVIGGFVGRSLMPADRKTDNWPMAAVALAAVAAAATLVWAAPVDNSNRQVTASFAVEQVKPGPDRYSHVTVTLDPPDAADGARWFGVGSWQGGKNTRGDIEKIGNGVYRTTNPIPVGDSWKSLLRLHDGRAMLAAPVHLPADPAIHLTEVKTPPTFTRALEDDTKFLQRERKPGVAGWLTTAGYLVVLAIALLMIAALTAGLIRFDRSQSGRGNDPYRATRTPVTSGRPISAGA